MWLTTFSIWPKRLHSFIWTSFAGAYWMKASLLLQRFSSAFSSTEFINIAVNSLDAHIQLQMNLRGFFISIAISSSACLSIWASVADRFLIVTIHISVELSNGIWIPMRICFCKRIRWTEKLFCVTYFQFEFRLVYLKSQFINIVSKSTRHAFTKENHIKWTRNTTSIRQQFENRPIRKKDELCTGKLCVALVDWALEKHR